MAGQIYSWTCPGRLEISTIRVRLLLTEFESLIDHNLHRSGSEPKPGWWTVSNFTNRSLRLRLIK